MLFVCQQGQLILFFTKTPKTSYIETCKSDYNINIVKIIYIYCALLDDIKTFYSVTESPKMAVLGSSCEVLAQITHFTQESSGILCMCDVTHGRGFGKKINGDEGALISAL